MNLLLLSNSRMPNKAYLEHAQPLLAETLAQAKSALLIPFAAVANSYEHTFDMVRGALNEAGLKSLALDSIHRHMTSNDATGSDANLRMLQAMQHADAIIVNGGNTYRLLQLIRQHNLLQPLRQMVMSGKTYVGWSAGTVICCPSIRTSNDMPIVDPAGLDALGLLDFQVNAHYTNATPPDWMGETRDQRLAEFLVLHPEQSVLCLPEGNWMRIRSAQSALSITVHGAFDSFWLNRHGSRILPSSSVVPPL